MDLNEIAWDLAKGALGTVSIYLAYASLLGSIAFTSLFSSEKIRDQEDLERMVSEEAKKLNLKVPIQALLTNETYALCRKGDWGYEVEVGGSFSRRSVVRHELYHIFKNVQRGDPEPPKKDRFWGKLSETLKYTFRDEPQAIAYQAFGLKL